MKARHTLVTALLISIANFAAATPQQAIQHYEAALHQQDLNAIDALLSDDVNIQLVLVPSTEAPIIISLTRKEFLQHLRTLWAFSSAHTCKIDKLQIERSGNLSRIQFHQREQYKLFGEDLTQDSEIFIELSEVGDKPSINAIRVVSERW